MFSDRLLVSLLTKRALDDAGKRKPSKTRSVGRIDGIVALAMAIGVAPLRPPTIDVEALIA